MVDQAEMLFRVPSRQTPRIQETHILLGPYSSVNSSIANYFPEAYPARLIVDSEYPIKPLDFDGISTYPLESRKSKVNSGMFGKPMDGSENILGFISKLPRILAGESLRKLIRAHPLRALHGKPIIWGIGGHVIKVGLGPVINDLMQSGFVTGIAMNGRPRSMILKSRCRARHRKKWRNNSAKAASAWLAKPAST